MKHLPLRHPKSHKPKPAKTVLTHSKSPKRTSIFTNASPQLSTTNDTKSHHQTSAHHADNNSAAASVTNENSTHAHHHFLAKQSSQLTPQKDHGPSTTKTNGGRTAGTNSTMVKISTSTKHSPNNSANYTQKSHTFPS